MRALGGAVLVTEQAGWRLAEVVDRWLELAGGTLHPCPPPVAPAFERPPAVSGPPLLEVRDLHLARGGRPLLDGARIDVREGEVVLLSGPNGAGKSSLARALAGHAVAASGALAVSATRLQRPERTTLLLSEASVQLFGDTVAGEMELGRTDPRTAVAALRSHRLVHLSGRAPWTLSRGERQRLLHAALDALHPQLMIVDEPGQGLDPEDLAELAGLIATRAQEGRACLLVSHRAELGGLAHRHLAIANHTVVDVGGTE